LNDGTVARVPITGEKNADVMVVLELLEPDIVEPKSDDMVEPGGPDIEPDDDPDPVA
jgi:hypothetical protein